MLPLSFDVRSIKLCTVLIEMSFLQVIAIYFEPLFDGFSAHRMIHNDGRRRKPKDEFSDSQAQFRCVRQVGFWQRQ